MAPIITEEEASNIQLDIPKFSVDDLYDVPPPLPNQSMFTAFLGPPRSGKSSLATSLLVTVKPQKLYSGIFSNVFYIVPLASFNSFKDNPFKSLSRDKLKHEFTSEVLQEIVERCEDYAKQKKDTLIIIDDFMSELKNVELRKNLEKLVANRRHIRANLWIISQSYRAIPLSTRKLLSSVYLFRVANLREIESIREELIPLDKSVFQAYYNYIFTEGGDPHAFMYLDVITGKIYNQFRRLSIKH